MNRHYICRLNCDWRRLPGLATGNSLHGNSDLFKLQNILNSKTRGIANFGQCHPYDYLPMRGLVSEEDWFLLSLCFRDKLNCAQRKVFNAPDKYT